MCDVGLMCDVRCGSCVRCAEQPCQLFRWPEQPIFVMLQVIPVFFRYADPSGDEAIVVLWVNLMGYPLFLLAFVFCVATATRHRRTPHDLGCANVTQTAGFNAVPRCFQKMRHVCISRQMSTRSCPDWDSFLIPEHFLYSIGFCIRSLFN